MKWVRGVRFQCHYEWIGYERCREGCFGENEWKISFFCHESEIYNPCGNFSVTFLLVFWKMFFWSQVFKKYFQKSEKILKSSGKVLLLLLFSVFLAQYAFFFSPIFLCMLLRTFLCLLQTTWNRIALQFSSLFSLSLCAIFSLSLPVAISLFFF